MLYLHIGQHKTGSTSIQWNLARNSEELKNKGWLYPKTGLDSSGFQHHRLANALWKNEGQNFADLDIVESLKKGNYSAPSK